MTNETIIDYVNLVLNKEQKGNSLRPARRNTVLQAVNIILFEREYQRAGETAAEKVKPLYDILMSNRAMKRFVTENNIEIDENGRGELPSEFREQIKLSILNGRDDWFSCPFVSEERLDKFRFSLLETPKTDEYVAVIRNDYFFVYPTNAENCHFIYLRNPIIPVYDYCLGTSTDHEYYMPPGSIIQDGKLKLGGAVLQNNVISPTGLSTGYTSTSVELDWDNSMHVAFANEILLLLGVNLQDQLAIQHANNERAIK